LLNLPSTTRWLIVSQKKSWDNFSIQYINCIYIYIYIYTIDSVIKYHINKLSLTLKLFFLQMINICLLHLQSTRNLLLLLNSDLYAYPWLNISGMIIIVFSTWK
jgi:hypothetical protein